ncbi:MAG: hypothetical protein JJT76_13375 [Clostridiaceae bacterium]|nr:hypothetical protein [Clostridiaceae bacterium]
MTGGWISLHRKILEHPLYLEKRYFTRFEAWVDLLLIANHKDKNVMVGMDVLEIKRGDNLTSIKHLADKWQWSRSKVKKFLDLLEGEGMITYESTSKYTLITIENYNKYQSSDEEREHQKDIKKTSEQHQSNIKKTSEQHQKDTNNNVNNVNKENKVNKDNKKHIYAITTPAENLLDPIEAGKDRGAQLEKTGKGNYSEDFEGFWNLYPKKVEKLKAYKCYQQRLKEGYTPLQLLNAVKLYMQQIKRENKQREYIKHCSTFLGPNKPFLDYLEGGEDHGGFNEEATKTTPYDKTKWLYQG